MHDNAIESLRDEKANPRPLHILPSEIPKFNGVPFLGLQWHTHTRKLIGSLGRPTILESARANHTTL